MSTAAPAIANKVYIVTGASRGVGLAICKTLHARGARFAMLARSENEIREHAEAFGDQALAIACDVGDQKNVFETVDKVAAHFGGIDGLVNNAGLANVAPVEFIKEEDFALMFKINVQGPLSMIQATLPHLRKRGGGNILNIGSASVHDWTEFAFFGAYSAVKAALERLTEELRLEVSEDNIAVTLFCLGSTMTHFGHGWDPVMAEKAMNEWIARGGKAPATMDPAFPAEAIVRCLESPKGACADYIRFRPFATQAKGWAMA